jgi:HD superfamily phosphohydrolase
MRDSYYSGMVMPVDIDRLCQSLTLKLMDTDKSEGTLTLQYDERARAVLEQYVFGLISLYTNVYMHRAVRAYETHWDRFCSFLKLKITSDTDFLKTNSTDLFHKAAALSDSNPDAYAILYRRPFRQVWQSKNFLVERLRREMLLSLKHSLRNVDVETSIDTDLRHFPHEHFFGQAFGARSLFKKLVFNQVRVFTRPEYSLLITKLIKKRSG